MFTQVCMHIHTFAHTIIKLSEPVSSFPSFFLLSKWKWNNKKESGKRWPYQRAIGLKTDPEPWSKREFSSNWISGSTICRFQGLKFQRPLETEDESCLPLPRKDMFAVCHLPSHRSPHSKRKYTWDHKVGMFCFRSCKIISVFPRNVLLQINRLSEATDLNIKAGQFPMKSDFLGGRFFSSLIPSPCLDVL